MKELLFVNDIKDVKSLVEEARALKRNPFAYNSIGKNKTLGLLFFDSSLRTRLSTQKAALNLGMNCIVMNFTTEAWQIEFEDGTVMDGNTSEHIREAAAVVSQYCDIIAVRAFATLKDRIKDQSEHVLRAFKRHATVPIINMESATEHPLQALADAITITELKNKAKPKVVLSWAPHPKALPQAVVNSFSLMMQKMEVDFYITHPPGYELNDEIVLNTPILYDQDEALKDADFVYVKNWSSFHYYGQILNKDLKWMITKGKMDLTNNGKFMHCLPVRRNVIVDDEVLNSSSSIVMHQANNRTYAAQVILKKILENEK